ncbi:uncharacterized protein [Ptychodera flava]|uniref:uncharacterized protein n=1 Tax=Ptychodera flava TaxID=63121 RepID=UPI00396A9407
MADSELAAVIDGVNDKLMKFYDEGDMKSISELYTEDCKFLPPGKEILRGRKAVEEAMQDMKDSGAAKLYFKSMESTSFGDYAYDWCTYTLFKEDGTVHDKGKGLAVWKKVDGKYYYHVDTFNSSIQS